MWPGQLFHKKLRQPKPKADYQKASESADYVRLWSFSVQLCAESMCKTLILVTVYKESSYNGSGYIEIIPRDSIGQPLYFLYYSESRYVYKDYIF